MLHEINFNFIISDESISPTPGVCTWCTKRGSAVCAGLSCKMFAVEWRGSRLKTPMSNWIWERRCSNCISRCRDSLCKIRALKKQCNKAIEWMKRNWIILRLGQVLCAEGQLERMEVQNYHDWFRAGVAHWLDIAVYKALKRIDRAVEFDTLQAVDNTVQYSSSAVDTLTIFYQIKVFWTQLAWPDMEGSYTFVAKIIDVSSVYIFNNRENLSLNKKDYYNIIQLALDNFSCQLFLIEVYIFLASP